MTQLEHSFLKYVNKTDYCWEWTGAINGRGYGNYSINCKAKSAHRVAYALWRGEIPAGMYVMHTCDNRKCVNPSHLVVGTAKDNMDDMARKGRRAEGERNGFAKLTKNKVRIMRLLKRGGITTKEIAKIMNVCYDTAMKVINRQAWRSA